MGRREARMLAPTDCHKCWSAFQDGPRKAAIYGLMLKFHWSLNADRVSRVEVFLDEGFLQYFWSEEVMNRTAAAICTIMEQKCPQVWSANKLQNSSQCINRFVQVPRLDPECKPGTTNAEGYSQACRNVHASFVLLDAGTALI